jgi:hypothetical protein
MKTEYAALAGRIEQTLLDIERVVERAEFLLQQAQLKNDNGPI